MPGGFPFGLDVCAAQDIGSVAGTSSGTTLTASATINTKGSYQQLIAATAYDISFVHVSIFNLSGKACLVDIAIGPSGSEVVLLPNIPISVRGNTYGIADFMLPLSIPAGTRIAARCQSATASSNVAVKLNGYSGGFTAQDGAAGADAIGVNTATSNSATITASSTVGLKGAYSQLIASTARDYAGFVALISGFSTGTVYLLDIAIGPSGSEVTIVPNFAVTQYTVCQCLWLPIGVPAGTRIAARCQATTASAIINLGLLGIYR